MIRFTSIIWMCLIHNGCDDTPRKAARESTQINAGGTPASLVKGTQPSVENGSTAHVRAIVEHIASDSGVYKKVCRMTAERCTNKMNISKDELIGAISRVYPEPNASAAFLAALVDAHNAINPADGENQRVFLQALSMELVFEILLSITRHKISETNKSFLLRQIAHLLVKIKSPSTQEVLKLLLAQPTKGGGFTSGLLILLQLSQMALDRTTSRHILDLIQEGYKEIIVDNKKNFDPKDFSEAVYHAKLQAILGRSRGESQRCISNEVLQNIYASLDLQMTSDKKDDEEEVDEDKVDEKEVAEQEEDEED